jgi:hypothetical protein
VEKYRDPHGQLKENLFLPLFNTNFISKCFKITDLTLTLQISTRKFGKIGRKKYRFFTSTISTFWACGNMILPLLQRFNPAEPVVEKSVIL